MTGYDKALNEQEKERIINESLPFIKYTAYRLARRLPPQLTVNDLISVGILGLLDALQRYEEGRVKLNTFVEHRIRGAMLDELRSQSWVPRSVRKKLDSIRKAHQELERELGRAPDEEEIAARVGLPLDDYYRVLQDAHNAIPLTFEDVTESGRSQSGQDAMENIADPDAKSPLAILEENNMKELLANFIEHLPEKEKIILSLYYWDELTMKEIGMTLGLSEGRVCQIHNQALIRLRARIDALVPH